MRKRWAEIRATFLTSITPLQTTTQFRELRVRQAVLSPFEEPGALIAFMSAKEPVEPDRKDAILAALIRAAQTGDGTQELATTLIWLALWPGLDAVYSRHLRFFGPNADELVCLISAAVTEQIGRLSLDRVRRIAGTFVMNVQRTVLKDRKREWKRASKTGPLPADDELDADDPAAAPFRAAVTTPGMTEEAETEHLLEILTPVVGEDARLLVDVLVHGYDQCEAGRRRGLGYDQARKRLQRARKKVAEHLSQMTSEGRVSLSGGERHDDDRNAERRVREDSGASPELGNRTGPGPGDRASG